MDATIQTVVLLLVGGFGCLLVFIGLYISMTDNREDPPQVINEFRSYGIKNHRHGRILRHGKIIGGYQED